MLPFKSLQRFHVAWRKISRQIWRLPQRTHNMIMKGLNYGLCEDHMFISRILRFAWSALNHTHGPISYVIQSVFKRANSLLSNNVTKCCRLINITVHDLVTLTPGNLKRLLKTACLGCIDDISRLSAQTIIELSKIRDRLLDCVLGTQEIQTIIEFLSSLN
jgi:hypothetical protein